MTVQPFAVEARESLAEWVRGRIAEHKGADPLAPVTVVTTNNYVGLALRHELSRHGFINVRTMVLARLAETIGAPRLAAASRRPLKTASEFAAIRHALDDVRPAEFAPAGSHPALIESLSRLFKELRSYQLDEESELARLAQKGPMLDAAVATFRRFRALLGSHGLYDSVDLNDAASAAARDPHARVLELDLGSIIVSYPATLTASEISLLNAVSERVTVDIGWRVFGDYEADALPLSQARALGVELPARKHAPTPVVDMHVISAPAAEEEVRAVLREVLQVVETQNTPLYRLAILYRNEATYAQMLRDLLGASAIPYSALDGRPLSASYAARTLLGLLRFVDNDLSRADVMEWLSSRAHQDREWPAPGQWERITRSAGIVRGIDQWRDRLDGYVQKLRFDSEGRGRDISESQSAYYQRQAEDAERIRDAIETLYANTRPPEGKGWPVHIAWLKRLMEAYVQRGDAWSDDQLEAHDLVGQIIGGLDDAAGIEMEVDVTTCIAMLTAALNSRRQPEGRLGTGVVIGPIAAANGMEFDHAFVLGVGEGSFPTVQPIDPILPSDESDPLQRRQVRLGVERAAFLAALSTVKVGTTLSFCSWDAQRRPAYPSRWLASAAQEMTQTAITAPQLRECPSETWLTRVDSPSAALAKTSFPLTVGERRLQVAICSSTAGISMARTPLGLRTDLPLRHTLGVIASRNSSQFTEYDGNISDVIADSALAGGLDGVSSSPTGVEKWAACGFRYFLERVLRVAPTEKPEDEERWETDRLAYGTLIHGILERFLSGLRADGRPGPGKAYTDSDRALLHGIAEEEFRALEARGGTGHPLIWQNERAAILIDLDNFLREDVELRRGGFVPAVFEQMFGFRDRPESWPSVVAPLDDGRYAEFRGIIDRVDFAPGLESPTSAQVVDYKTGKAMKQAELDADPVVAGTRLQLAVYAGAVQEFAAQRGITLAAAFGSYWFVTSGSKFESVRVPASQQTEARLRDVARIVDEGIREGAFLAVPGDESFRPPNRTTWDNCAYCEYDRICPTSRQVAYERKRDDGAASLHQSLAITVTDDE